MIRLGNTDMKIKRVGFGGIPIQRITQEDADVIIKELINTNVNFIDTARGYTVSESYIGNAIKGNRDKFVLATKSMARDYESMKKDIEISLANLQTDKIDLYQLHNVKIEELDSIMGENGAYQALLEAKESGKIDYIGITSHSVDTIEKALDMDGKFQTIQFPYNIVESQGEEAFKKAHEKGIGTIVMKPLAGGALDDATLAIKYILDKPFIDVVIPGMESIEQVNQNVLASENTTLTTGDMEKIEEIKSTLGKKFCRRCGYCLPCPMNVNIPQNFLLEGYYSRYNLKDWSKERYLVMDGKASDCVACGMCETKCPYDLPIIEMLKEVSEKLD